MPLYIYLGRAKITRIRAAIFILILFNITVWPAVFCGVTDNIRATFLDVGQGDCAFLEFSGRGNILIDGGGGEDDRFDAGESIVAPFLWNHGVRTVDMLVATHFHGDHIGGLIYILKNFNIGSVVDNGAIGDGREKRYEEYLRLIKMKNIRRISVREGDLLKAFGGAEIFVLNPENKERLQDSNDSSLVMKIVYKNISFLFCGDVKGKAISRLIEYGNFLKSDVLKVPHHGGVLGGGKVVADFFGFVAPGASVISVGASNQYNMPSGETMNIVTYSGGNSYLTKDDGAKRCAEN
jgi:competence protein ComEC